ncbi:MAG: FtsB family cell division protein [Minisyncoccales bacterium]
MIAKNKRIKRRHHRQKDFNVYLITILLLSLIGFLVVSNLRIRPQWLELQKRLAELKKQTQILEERNEELKASIKQTQSDVYWEARLREQGYIKPGEQAIVIYPEKEETENRAEIEKEKKFWENLLDWIWRRE